MKKNKVLTWIIFGITIALDIFILVNAFINGEKSTIESNNFAHTTAGVINTVKPETITEENFSNFASFLRKFAGHFGLFAVTGVFATWSIFRLFSFKKSIKIIVSFLHGLLLAFASEFIQVFVSGRSGEIADVGIDFGGYFLGFIFIFLILLFAAKKRKK